MRDYGKVFASIWNGDTGRKLRGNEPAQILSLYLITNGQANMIGCYYLPLILMSYETGISIDRCHDALKSIQAAEFAQYDFETEWVWVPEMAHYQIGAELKAADNRIKGLKKEINGIKHLRFRALFIERYRKPYNLNNILPKLEGPSKGLRSQEHEQEQEHQQEHEQEQEKPASPAGLATPPKSSQKTPGFDPSTIIVPAALESPSFRAAWAEWLNYRRDRRLSSREATIRKQLDFLASLGVDGAVACIDESIRNSWQGLFKPKATLKDQPVPYSGLAKFVSRGEDR